ncbi:unnamed protein product [Prorocentrum cordatum]|uniref:Uncharacterized protein n=1 Tax=Prorocentrum cordatum TaxID=2364126 RepID=A0ABN9VKN5_9DINO|nr:unnamed protein product [Polarella glacialis]
MGTERRGITTAADVLPLRQKAACQAAGAARLGRHLWWGTVGQSPTVVQAVPGLRTISSRRRQASPAPARTTADAMPAARGCPTLAHERPRRTPRQAPRATASAARGPRATRGTLLAGLLLAAAAAAACGWGHGGAYASGAGWPPARQPGPGALAAPASNAGVGAEGQGWPGFQDRAGAAYDQRQWQGPAASQPPVAAYASHSEPSHGRPVRTPSDKQLAYAQEIAAMLGVEVWPDARCSSEACAEFIREHRSVPYDRMRCSPDMSAQMPRSAPPSTWSPGQASEWAPTPKQMKFAWELAECMGMDLPQGALVSRDTFTRMIDDFITARNLVQKWKNSERFIPNAGDQTPEFARPVAGSHSQFADRLPTHKQLALAELLASQAGMQVPQSAYDSAHQCSIFIDERKFSVRGMSIYLWVRARRLCAMG